MTSKEKKRLLRQREKQKQSRPKFKRPESWRYKRLKKSWRKPDGIDNKMRHHLRGWPANVSVGYRGPKAVRGLTRTGKEEVLVHNVSEIEEVDPETQVARIGGTVGRRKKVDMTNRADELGIKIINRPEEALTFATISEISEELLLEEEEPGKEDKKKKPRKKRTSKELTAEELAELEAIEKGITKKAKPTKKTTTTKKKAKEKEELSVEVDAEIVVTYKGRSYSFDKRITMGDLEDKRGVPNIVKNKVAEIRGWKTWTDLE
jgi:large subunit ribosomal protein L32e